MNKLLMQVTTRREDSPPWSALPSWVQRTLMLLGVAFGGAPALAAPLACLIEPSKMADIGSPVVGVLESVRVDRGTLVRKGEAVAHLRGEVERASLGVAQARADARAEYQAALAASDFARRKLERSLELEKQEFIAPQAVEQSRSEASVAEQRMLAAREQQRLYEGELSMARSQLAQRTIYSPIDGVVTDRFMNEGERVEQQPILRIATLDPLRVEVILPTQHLGQVKPGDWFGITPELVGSASLRAKVTLVDPVIDAASRTFRVRLELPNPGNGIQAGLRCTATLGPAEPVSKVGQADTKSPTTSVSGAKVAASAPTAARVSVAKNITPASFAAPAAGKSSTGVAKR